MDTNDRLGDQGDPWTEDEILGVFASEQSRDLFERCMSCDTAFDAASVPHFVQKNYRDGDVIFETAVCLPCIAAEEKKWSIESRRRIEEWTDANPLAFRPLALCGFCGEEAARHAEGYARMGIALAPDAAAVAAICWKCQETLDGLLSDETRRALDNFSRRICPGVPEGLDRPLTVFFA